MDGEGEYIIASFEYLDCQDNQTQNIKQSYTSEVIELISLTSHYNMSRMCNRMHLFGGLGKKMKDVGS